MLARKVLLVDDSKSARFVLSKLLQRHNLDVAMVDSAEAALDFLKSEQPDAIFMDHLMPGMDGLSATSAIKKNPDTAHIPVVMCTSNDGDDYIREAKSHGALGTLLKPPASGKLEAILAAVDDAIKHDQSAPAETAKTVVESAADEVVQAFPSENTRQLQELVASAMEQFERRFIDRMAEQRQQWVESLRSELEPVNTGLSAEQLENFVSDRLSQQQVEFSLQLAELEKQLGEKTASPVDFESQVRELARETSESVAVDAARQAAGEVAARCAAETVTPVLEQRLDQFNSELETREQGPSLEDVERLLNDRLQEQQRANAGQLDAFESRIGDTLASSPSLLDKVTESAQTTATQVAREQAYDSAAEAVAPMLDERLAEINERLSAQQADAAQKLRAYAFLAALVGVASAALVYILGI